MYDKLYKPLRRDKDFGGFIERIWEVRADMSYDVRWHKRYPHKGLIILRTFSGEGLIFLNNGRKIFLQPQTILMLNPHRVSSYKTVKPLWSFLWFELKKEKLFDFSTEKVIYLPLSGNENIECKKVLNLLGTDEISDKIADLKLSLIVMEWLVAIKRSHIIPDERKERLAKIAKLMLETADKPISVSELASNFFLSESRFRQIFKTEFGVSPKNYYNQIRMSKILQRLRTSEMKLSEIAEELSFASQYHLSREFKKYFGQPPSAYKPNKKR